jgi:hypothetical protein
MFGMETSPSEITGEYFIDIDISKYFLLIFRLLVILIIPSMTV